MKNLSDAELRVMNILWDQGDTSAARIVDELAKEGLSRSASYTLLYRCIEKGAVARRDPGFACSALLHRDAAQKNALRNLVDTLFCGSPKNLFAAFLDAENVSPSELEELKGLVDEYAQTRGSDPS